VQLRFENVQAAASLDSDTAENAHQSPSFNQPSSEGYGVTTRTPTEAISVDSSRVSEPKSPAQPDLTRDTCRELELIPGEVRAAYYELNGQITAKLDAFVGKVVDATEEFRTLIIPLVDQMQSLLSERGRLRKLLDLTGAPQWGEWFDDFEKRLHLDISLRTIQRWLKAYRLEQDEELPAPNINVLVKQTVRHIESKAQAEKLESVVKHRKQVDPANRADLIRAIEAKIEKWQVYLAKLKKGFVPPVSETGKALPFTQAEITKAAIEQAAYWRKEGFPFHDKSETERGRELHLLLDFDHSNLINDGVVRQTMHGLGTAGSYFPHMMSVRSGKFRTPLEVFEGDDLVKAIESRIIADGKLRLTPNQVRKACMCYSGSHAVSNFRPSGAAAIYNKYLPETGGVVFDPSAGFGGRLLGALGCRKVKRYVACDPATETFTGLQKMKNELLPAATRTLRRNMGVELYPCGSEDMRPNLQHSSVDCVLWSPPYFSQEQYSDEETQSYKRFPGKDEWLDQFMGTTLDNCAYCLKPGGILAVNIADVPTFPDLEKAFLALAESKGWTRTETLYIELSPMWGTRNPGYEPKLEPIFVFAMKSE
jgi:hypothetical protein